MVEMAAQRLSRAEAAWWAFWWTRDYSWQNLKQHPVGAGGDFRIQGKARDLEAFWRLDQQGAALRTDDQMRGELVAGPDGRLWHKVHVPMRWQDGTPAKCAWSAQEIEETKELVTRQMSALAASTAHLSNSRRMSDLSGVVAPIRVPHEANIWLIDGYI